MGRGADESRAVGGRQVREEETGSHDARPLRPFGCPWLPHHVQTNQTSVRSSRLTADHACQARVGAGELDGKCGARGDAENVLGQLAEAVLGEPGVQHLLGAGVVVCGRAASGGAGRSWVDGKQAVHPQWTPPK